MLRSLNSTLLPLFLLLTRCTNAQSPTLTSPSAVILFTTNTGPFTPYTGTSSFTDYCDLPESVKATYTDPIPAHVCPTSASTTADPVYIGTPPVYTDFCETPPEVFTGGAPAHGCATSTQSAISYNSQSGGDLFISSGTPSFTFSTDTRTEGIIPTTTTRTQQMPKFTNAAGRMDMEGAVKVMAGAVGAYAALL